MATFKCKMCGGNVIAEEGQAYGICEVCGCVVTLPKEDEEKIRKDIPQKAMEQDFSVNNVPGVEALYKRAVMFLEDGDYIQANEYFNRILDIDPEYAPAYIGKLCANRRVRTEADLKKKNKSLEKDANYQKALRFADEHQKMIYESYTSADQKKQGAVNKQEKRMSNPKEKKHRKGKFARISRKLKIVIAIIALLLIVVLAFFAVRLIKEVKFDRSYAVGKYVTFGVYPQSEYGMDETPIEWIVLDRDGDRALLISRYGLDAQSYNVEYENITWQESTIRTWLNDDFINRAFTDKEQMVIQLTNVDNSDSQGFDFAATVLGKTGYASTVSGGNNTQDKIFLLSYSEANRYLNVFFSVDDYSNTASRITATEYAIAQGIDISGDNKTVDDEISANWWLRSPGNYQSSAACVSSDGSLLYYEVYMDNVCVRPAMWIDISLIPGLTKSEDDSNSIFASILDLREKDDSVHSDASEKVQATIGSYVSGVFNDISAKFTTAVENGTIWYFVAGAVVFLLLLSGLIVLLIILGKQKKAKKAQTKRTAAVRSVSSDSRDSVETYYEQPVKGTTVRVIPQGGSTQRVDGGTIRMADNGGTERISEIKSIDLRLAEMRGGEFCDMHSVTVECDDKVIVGRSDTADLTIDDRSVSSNHLSITYDGEDIYIADLNSTNGTKLNGTNITPNTPVKVVKNDKITIGKTTLKLQIYEK